MSISPYLRIGKTEQLAIVKELRDTQPYKTTFSEDYQPAMLFIRGSLNEETASPTAQALAEAMNQKAQEVLRRAGDEQSRADFETNYEPWKRELDVFTGLFPVANGMTQGIMFSGLAMGGLSLWSFKSSKCLAAANGCAALALLIFSGALEKYILALHTHHEAIQDLKIENRQEFSKKN